MPNPRMAEAEVSVRLANWLIANRHAERVEVAIDGAHVKTGDTIHFDLPGFLTQLGWEKTIGTPFWQCDYANSSLPGTCLSIHSNPGRGDVFATLRSGAVLRVECKKGPLLRSRQSQEYVLLHEALGQILTTPDISDSHVLAVAVPHSERFAQLASRWRDAPLIRQLALRILTVDASGTVYGLDLP